MINSKFAKLFLVFILVIMVVGCSKKVASDITDEVSTETVTEAPINGLNGSGGGFIAFENEEKGDYNFELFIMNADGTAVTKLTDNPGYDGGPTFSPDMKKIAFASARNGSVDIYMFDLEAYLKGEKQELVKLTDKGNNYYPAWSPDGLTIAFASDRDGGFRIFKMNSDGSNPEIFVDNPDACFPSWSPDGTKLAFNAKYEGSNEIYTMNVDGSNITRLTNNPGDDQFACWSPDGTQIAFSNSGSKTHFDIWKMDENGGNQVILISDSRLDEFPKWSPDGTQILFRSSITGSDQLTVMNADGSDVHALTNLKGQSMPYDWKQK